jgi:hypothetical protein
MHRLLILILITSLISCKAEEYYYKQALYEQEPNLEEGDSLTFHFKGQSNIQQYWQGNLIAFINKGELVINETGKWTQYNPENPEEIWTTLIWDSEGQNLVEMSKVHNTNNQKLWNVVNCSDTVINNINLRKCDYKWFYENGELEKEYSIITFTNPNRSKKYGYETIYSKDGSIKSKTYHNRTIKSGKIK